MLMNYIRKESLQMIWNWMSPDNQTKNQIDYISNTEKDVTVIKKFGVSSDHRISKTNFRE